MPVRTTYRGGSSDGRGRTSRRHFSDQESILLMAAAVRVGARRQIHCTVVRTEWTARPDAPGVGQPVLIVIEPLTVDGHRLRLQLNAPRRGELGQVHSLAL